MNNCEDQDLHPIRARCIYCFSWIDCAIPLKLMRKKLIDECKWSWRFCWSLLITKYGACLKGLPNNHQRFLTRYALFIWSSLVARHPTTNMTIFKLAGTSGNPWIPRLHQFQGDTSNDAKQFEGSLGSGAAEWKSRPFNCLNLLHYPCWWCQLRFKQWMHLVGNSSNFKQSFCVKGVLKGTTVDSK